MKRVEMEHPTLPGQKITVGEQAVPHHAAAGWQVVAVPLEDGDETESDPVDLERQEPRRRRRRNDDGNPADVDTEAGAEPAANATEGDVTR